MVDTKKTKTQKEPEKIMVSPDLLIKYEQMLWFIKNIVSDIDQDLKRISQVVQQLEKFDPKDPESLDVDIKSQEMFSVTSQRYNEEDAEVIEGTFDWYFMVGSDQKKYPVPLNYASKTKLVPWDSLKLKILKDGKFIYKLTRPVERQHVRAILSLSDDNKYTAITDDGKPYFLNQAAVTFFKGKPWDELYIVINADWSWGFAAIEAIIKK